MKISAPRHFYLVAQSTLVNVILAAAASKWAATIGPVRDRLAKILLGPKWTNHGCECTRLALQHSEERFRQIAENLPGALWVADLKWNFLYVSPGYESVYQRPVRDFIENQQSFLEFVYPDDREKVIANYTTRPLGVPFEEEFRVLLPDGSVNWVRNRAFPIRSADGQLEGMTGLTTNITENKRVQEALRRSEAEFRQLADAMPQIVWSADPNGVADYYNQQWYDFSGLPPGTLGNEHWGEIVHPDDMEPMLAAWTAAMRSGKPYEMECRLRRASDGEYRWFLARARPVCDASGRIERWYGTSTDITERKETETAFTATAERLRLAIETTRSGTWDWNMETGEVLWSAQHNEMFGLPREQRVGNYEQWLTCVHPADQAMAALELQTAIDQRRDFSHELRSVHRDGSVHWILSSGRAFYNAANLPVRMVGVVREITATKNAEVALRESEQRFRLANLHAPYPNVLFADDGEILQINEAWLHLTGYTRQELVTMQDWIERAYPSQEPVLDFQRLEAHFPERQGESFERAGRRFRCRDGTERIWDMSVVDLGQLPDGRRLRIASGTDVTARHRAELMLRQAKEEAERANAAKSLFLSRMSHELRTPLNAILGFGQVLDMSSLSEQDTQCVQYILKGGQHLLTLVDEVLDLTRAETGELKLQPTIIDADQLVRECVGLTSKLAQAKQIDCSADDGHPAEDRLVLADGQRLRQVLLNLISNAIKYNGAKGQVTVTCKRVPNQRWRLSVCDTGPGIGPDELRRLFVPFERLGHEYGEIEGSGLGLVVSKRLVEAMSGTIGAESQVGMGSTFWIELPAAEKPVGQTRVVSGERATIIRAEMVSCATLLYIEDNASNLQVIRSLVERARPHWQFFSATSGQAGLDQARMILPDVILLDLQLPDMRGDTVLSELRKFSPTQCTPVVMLSADATAPSRERLIGLGANDYMSKPFNVNELLEKLDGILSESVPENLSGKHKPSEVSQAKNERVRSALAAKMSREREKRSLL